MARVSAEPVGWDWEGLRWNKKKINETYCGALTQGCFWKQKANHQTAIFGAKIQKIIRAFRIVVRSNNTHTILWLKWKPNGHYIVCTQVAHWSWIVQRSLISAFTEEHRGWVWHNMVRIGQYRVNSSGSGLEQAAGSCEHSSEHPGSIKCREFIDQLRNY
jgi:hypothetical protein